MTLPTLRPAPCHGALDAMKPSALAPLLAAALLAPGAASAHGVSVEVERRGGGVAARARWEGGGPLAGARYAIVSPADPGRAVEEGLTDAHGWVAFVPDAPGTWRVRIVDASGHGHLAEIEVPPSAVSAAVAAEAGSPVRPGEAPSAVAGSPAAQPGTPDARAEAARPAPPAPRAAEPETAGPIEASPPARRGAVASLLRLGAGVAVLALVFVALAAVLRRRAARGR